MIRYWITGGDQLAQAQQQQPVSWEALRRQVAWKLVERPLPRLQRLGTGQDPFLYHCDWNEEPDRTAFNRGQLGQLIVLKPGVRGALQQLGSLLRPMIQQRWAALVSRINHLPESGLDRHLFGSERASLTPVRALLMDLQARRCLYCSHDVRDSGEIDHFIPWARHPNNELHNLVLACKSCNGSKRDFIVSGQHVDRWCTHLQTHAGALATSGISWEIDRAKSLNVARNLFAVLRPDTPLWKERDGVRPVFQHAGVSELAHIRDRLASA